MVRIGEGTRGTILIGQLDKLNNWFLQFKQKKPNNSSNKTLQVVLKKNADEKNNRF
jgi:hypothetical protein